VILDFDPKLDSYQVAFEVEHDIAGWDFARRPNVEGMGYRWTTYILKGLDINPFIHFVCFTTHLAGYCALS
jgi:hypothetical protein